MKICDNLAYDFFTACGLNSLAVKANCSLREPAQITSLIANGLVDADSAAQEAIDGWGLDHAEQGELTHMRRNGYTREDLVEAMQRFFDGAPAIAQA